MPPKSHTWSLHMTGKEWFSVWENQYMQQLVTGHTLGCYQLCGCRWKWLWDFLRAHQIDLDLLKPNALSSICVSSVPAGGAEGRTNTSREQDFPCLISTKLCLFKQDGWNWSHAWVKLKGVNLCAWILHTSTFAQVYFLAMQKPVESSQLTQVNTFFPLKNFAYHPGL